MSSTEPAGDTATANQRRNMERRKRSIPVAIDRRNQEPSERKKLMGERRRQVDPTTCEREYTEEEIDFMKTISSSL